MICLAFNICICVTSVQAHDKMLVLTHDETELSLDSKVLISGFAGFKKFLQNAGFWLLLGQNVVLVLIQMYK